MKVLTAHDLLDGAPVWLTEDDRWSRDIAEAEIIEDEAHGALRLLLAQSQPGVVVGPYLAAVKPGPIPVEYRETFRARRPQVKTLHHV